MNRIVIGVDEVGRGPWAGPLVSCAVAFRSEHFIWGLTDSKKLRKRARERLSMIIKEQALAIGIGWVESATIDEFGLTKATSISMHRAISQIKLVASETVIDGNIDYLNTPSSHCVVKADSLYPSVAAASVIAKVARDAYMSHIAILYPAYGFAQHAGYGTKMHQEALSEHGISPLHRRSFAPVRALL